MHVNWHCVSAAILAGTFLFCDETQSIIRYVPEVTFTGYINGIYDSLAGNLLWPNRCRLAGDTIRIYCYSTGFSETGKIRQGDLLRLDLYPDSTFEFVKRNILFHMVRYHSASESYVINRGDTSITSVQFVAEIVAYSPSAGSYLELKEIYVSTSPVAKGEHLEIKKGHLFGSVH